MLDDGPDHFGGHVAGKQLLGNRLEIGGNNHAAIKARDRLRDFQGLDQHLHAARRPAAGNPKQDAGIVQLLNCLDGAGSEDFVLGDERAIDIGDDEANSEIWGAGLGAHK